MTADVEITRFWTCAVPGDGYDIVAKWRATAGEFRLWDGGLRRYDDGRVVVTLPGRAACGVSLRRDGDVWPALEAAVLERWEAIGRVGAAVGSANGGNK